MDKISKTILICCIIGLIVGISLITYQIHLNNLELPDYMYKGENSKVIYNWADSKGNIIKRRLPILDKK